MDRHTLINAIEAYAARHELKATTVCQYALRNRHFLRNLQEGRDYQMGTAQRLLDWLSSTDNSQRVSLQKVPQGQERQANVNVQRGQKQ